MKLQQARKFSLSLPETNEELHFEYTSFRVCGKIFATAPPGGIHLHVFVDEAERAPLIAAHPDIYEPLYWGKKVSGVRVMLVRADSAAVNTLLKQAWLRKAPKRLAAEWLGNK
ncbi:MAG: MmcQ/YjbR family DNA-binding protein [Betaproteobacteria bacterium]